MWGESDLLNKIFKIIKATTDEERKSIAEGSEFLMDIVTQIRKFLYDEETKEMKNIQDKWKREARKEGLASGMAQGIKSEKTLIAQKLIGKLSIDEISKATGLSKQEIQKLN